MHIKNWYQRFQFNDRTPSVTNGCTKWSSINNFSLMIIFTTKIGLSPIIIKSSLINKCHSLFYSWKLQKSEINTCHSFTPSSAFCWASSVHQALLSGVRPHYRRSKTHTTPILRFCYVQKSGLPLNTIFQISEHCLLKGISQLNVPLRHKFSKCCYNTILRCEVL